VKGFVLLARTSGWILRWPLEAPGRCAGRLLAVILSVLAAWACTFPDDLRGDDYIFDPAELHHFELEVDPVDWAWLQQNALLQQYVPAAVHFEGRRWGNAAVRFKGAWGTLVSCFDDSGSERLCPKLSVKVSFNRYEKGRFHGLRKLILHSSVRDPSMLREVVGYSLFRTLGVHAPRASHARLTVNGEYLGVFVLVEYIDKEFVKERFAAAQGNLYKQVWPTNATAEAFAGALRTNKEQADVSRMLALQEVIAGTSDASFPADIEPFLDLDYLARYFAVDRAIHNVDGIRGFYCYGADSTDCRNSNHYWYDDPSGTISLLPWDLDYTFGEVNSDLGQSQFATDPDTCTPIHFCDYWGEENCGPSVEEVYLLMPQCERLYGLVHRATWDGTLEAFRALVDGPMSKDAIVSLARAHREKIAGAVADDPYGPGGLVFESANDWLEEVLVGQVEAIEALLAELGR
jgi:hypothetical protein